MLDICCNAFRLHPLYIFRSKLRYQTRILRESLKQSSAQWISVDIDIRCSKKHTHAICSRFSSKCMSCLIDNIGIKGCSQHHATRKTCRRHNISRRIACHFNKCKRRIIIGCILYKLFLQIFPDFFPDLCLFFCQLVRTEIVKYNISFFCCTKILHQPCFFLIAWICTPGKDQICDQLFIIDPGSSIQHTDCRHPKSGSIRCAEITCTAYHVSLFFYCHLFQYCLDLICHIFISCYL